MLSWVIAVAYNEPALLTKQCRPAKSQPVYPQTGLCRFSVPLLLNPLMRFVYMRHRTYRPYYPAHSTPFRKNGRLQFRRYRQPGKKK